MAHMGTYISCRIKETMRNMNAVERMEGKNAFPSLRRKLIKRCKGREIQDNCKTVEREMEKTIHNEQWKLTSNREYQFSNFWFLLKERLLLESRS